MNLLASFDEFGSFLSQAVLYGFIVIVFCVVIFSSIVLMISIFENQPSLIQKRLNRLKGIETGGSTQTLAENLTQGLTAVAKPVAKSLYSAGQNDDKQKALFAQAGYSNVETQLDRFKVKRASYGIIAGTIAFVVSVLVTTQATYILCGLLGGFVMGSMLPQMMLKSTVSKRKKNLVQALPDTLDLMVVCVEAGLGVDAMFHRTSKELSKAAPEMALELNRLNSELNAGISRVEAFQNLGKRGDVPELRSLCAMIIQADKMGTSIADTLRIYASDLRIKRRQKAEEMASKASVKMIFPLVFFIFPPLFVVLLGPTVIQAIIVFTEK
ncbi:MAG: type II secretion system F family protein [Cyanobacteria bacterium P01_H01_bin.74]